MEEKNEEGPLEDEEPSVEKTEVPGESKPMLRPLSPAVKRWAHWIARPVAVQLRTALFLFRGNGEPARGVQMIDSNMQLMKDEAGKPKVFASYSPELQTDERTGDPVCQYVLFPVVLTPHASGELMIVTRHEPSGSFSEVTVEPSEILAVTEVVHVEQESRIVIPSRG